MVKFCPECGYKLVQEFKYCPECGFELEQIRLDSSAKNEAPEKPLIDNGLIEKKICDNCGEENDMDNIICSGCGIKFTGAKTEKVHVKEVKQNENIIQNAKPKPAVKLNSTKKNINETKTTVNAKVKSLNRAKTITIIAVGVGIAIIILIFSGLLNSLFIPGNSVSDNPKTTANQKSGVDLSSIQKINDLEATIKNNPHDTTAILDLAHLKNDAGMYEQAIFNYKQYLILAPKDPDARIDMGICYYNLQNYESAISEMEQAIKYDPKHQIGYLDLGIVNLSAGKMDKSQEWLKKAVEIDPNSEYGKKAQELLSSHNNKPNGGK
jgi:cytochrome c-type biogenesis protein CcmH/NrfG